MGGDESHFSVSLIVRDRVTHKKDAPVLHSPPLHQPVSPRVSRVPFSWRRGETNDTASSLRRSERDCERGQAVKASSLDSLASHPGCLIALITTKEGAEDSGD